MKFTVLTLFPEQVEHAVRHSIIGRALEAGMLSLTCVDIRDFAINDYGQVDDAPFGGGRGMVMRCEPIYDAWRSVVAEGSDVRTLVMSPAGAVFDDAMARELAEEPALVLVCGHYEGIDARVIDAIGAEEVSIGDFVLTGGELAAAVMIDAIGRQVPGVLPDEEASDLESFADGLLEWPQYTRPREWRGRSVPDVLVSGHDANIHEARRVAQVIETLKKRPDLLVNASIDLDLWVKVVERLVEDKTNET